MLIVLSFLIPPAIYLLTLAFRNRGRHPVMLSGRWDFAGVVFAMSGFLLLGGPAILAALYQRWRLSWVLGRTRFLNGVAENWYFWISLWILYFAAVIMCIALVMWLVTQQHHDPAFSCRDPRPHVTTRVPPRRADKEDVLARRVEHPEQQPAHRPRAAEGRPGDRRVEDHVAEFVEPGVEPAAEFGGGPLQVGSPRMIAR